MTRGTYRERLTPWLCYHLQQAWACTRSWTRGMKSRGTSAQKCLWTWLSLGGLETLHRYVHWLLIGLQCWILAFFKGWSERRTSGRASDSCAPSRKSYWGKCQAVWVQTQRHSSGTCGILDNTFDKDDDIESNKDNCQGRWAEGNMKHFEFRPCDIQL